MTHTTIDDTTPAGCSLSAADYRQRVRDTGDVAQQALRDRQPISGGVRLTFAYDPGVRERLEGVVAAEATCCSFLALDLSDDAGDLVLSITGPPEATPIIEELFS